MGHSRSILRLNYSEEDNYVKCKNWPGIPEIEVGVEYGTRETGIVR